MGIMDYGARLRQRATHRHDGRRRGQTAIIAIVGTLVLLRLLTSAVAAIFLTLGNEEFYRLTLLTGTGLSSALDIVFLLLVWGLFEANRRIEQEADRVQAFMDNVYRRL